MPFSDLMGVEIVARDPQPCATPLTVFQGRCGDRNDRAMRGAALLLLSGFD